MCIESIGGQAVSPNLCLHDFEPECQPQEPDPNDKHQVLVAGLAASDPKK